MKALIWIVCLILDYIIQNIAKALVKLIPVTEDSGVVMVALFNGILAGASICFCIWLAIKLCKELDWHRAKKKAAQEGMTVSEYGRRGLSEDFLTKLEAFCKVTPDDRIKYQFKLLVKKGKLTKEQSIILYKEFVG